MAGGTNPPAWEREAEITAVGGTPRAPPATPGVEGGARGTAPRQSGPPDPEWSGTRTSVTLPESCRARNFLGAWDPWGRTTRAWTRRAWRGCLGTEGLLARGTHGQPARPLPPSGAGRPTRGPEPVPHPLPRKTRLGFVLNKRLNLMRDRRLALRRDRSRTYFHFNEIEKGRTPNSKTSGGDPRRNRRS